MGEIAEMMLEGAMCQCCGEMIDDEQGFPMICAGCQRENDVDAFGEPRKRPAKSLAANPIKGSELPRLAKKLHARMIYIEQFCNGHSGMYPGDHWSIATNQYAALQKLGYVERYTPHNQAHKERAVITPRGRQYLLVHS